MKQGCVTGLFRGEDSTGLMQVMSNNAVRVRRSILDGYEFSRMKKIDEILGHVDSARATFIHHRKATMGSVTLENCHPFEHESADRRYVCGVHNGTISGAPSKEDGISFDVDSDWLYWKIANAGAPHALGLAKHGAYALVWYQQDGPDDDAQRRIYMAANDERPLHFGFVKDQNLMMVASEASMLYWLAERNSITLEDIFCPKADIIYGFDYNGELRNYTSTKVEKVEKPIPAPVYSSGGYSPSYGADEGWERGDDSFYSRLSSRPGHIYRDFHGPAGLADVPVMMGEEVDFIFQRAAKAPGGAATDSWEVRGEVTVHVNGNPKTFEAMIPNVDAVRLDNIQRSDSCWVRVYGMRHEIDKSTGITDKYILVSPPAVIQLDGDDDIPETSLVSLEDDSPWDEDGQPIVQNLDEALGNVVSGRVVRGPMGRFITAKEFERMTKDGCANCPASITIADAASIGWYDANGGPLCAGCVDDIYNSLRVG